VAKIAVFGGSFDPVHKGHIQIARFALEAFKLKKLIFVLAFASPHKKKHRYAAVEDRLNMIDIAAGGIKKSEISLYEIEKQKAVFTYQTLDYFQSLYPRDEIYNIMGSDSFLKLSTWKNADYMAERYKFIVAKRPNADMPPNVKYLSSCLLMDGEIADVSSTLIRNLIKDSNYSAVKCFLDKKVCDYIVQKGLYR
jgi:nicotinate-nucleotide adenylyltransferase